MLSRELDLLYRPEGPSLDSLGLMLLLYERLIELGSWRGFGGLLVGGGGAGRVEL